MLVESHEKLSGNARFEGFAIDLASELAGVLGFNFTFKLVDDDKVAGIPLLIIMIIISVWQSDISWEVERYARGGYGWHSGLLHSGYIHHLCQDISLCIHHAMAQPWHFYPLCQAQSCTPISCSFLGTIYNRCNYYDSSFQN